MRRQVGVLIVYMDQDDQKPITNDHVCPSCSVHRVLNPRVLNRPVLNHRGVVFDHIMSQPTVAKEVAKEYKQSPVHKHLVKACLVNSKFQKPKCDA